MMGKPIVVVGSINADYVVRVARRPDPGETVADAVFEMHPGGKGANQAVAVALAGGEGSLVARVGDDGIGMTRIAELRAMGVGTDQILVTPGAGTGAAFITVTADGQNSIIVAPGANARLSPADLDSASDALAKASLLVLQLEVPIDAVSRAVELVAPSTIVVMNFSPASELPGVLMRRVDVLVANEGEAAWLSGDEVSSPQEALRAAKNIRELGIEVVVVTLGPAGAVVVGDDLAVHVPAPKVDVVDTTGAGDAFVGALAVSLALSLDLSEAVEMAVMAGSMTTQRVGAQPLMPRRFGHEPVS